MYKNDSERIIFQYLERQNQKERRKHKKSYKISPSKLANPTLHAVLDILGHEPDQRHYKVYGIFARGHQVEEAVLRAYRQDNAGTQAQQKHEYRDCVGYSDFESQGIIYEVKSTNNQKFIRTIKERKPQTSHAIQLCFYLAAANHESGRILYVNADNLQTVEFKVFKSQWIDVLDARIDAIRDCIFSGTLCDFSPLEPYHNKPMYLNYRDYFNVTGKEAEEILKMKDPKAYELLKSKELVKLWSK